MVAEPALVEAWAGEHGKRDGGGVRVGVGRQAEVTDRPYLGRPRCGLDPFDIGFNLGVQTGDGLVTITFVQGPEIIVGFAG